ncbi:GrpB family protein [Candidatus Berkiella cookevillensis]|uniref:Dephospho-CoA kinase/protein folding accessory domain-containing protein n=1 Tax=Candidatus Berkiella cookevillensis TaxID=437022 RepID=A0A0Q9YSN9_9GAMM|nr:GrpB family protein [Candidatus Berkiella cookevillensis]MCS5709315.1 GrpB family protein [Candidatus Berkiella cookevillensis]
MNKPPAKDMIEFSDYHSEWSVMAMVEIALLKKNSKDLTNIILHVEHVGSTAIPGIKAKPIIDLYVGVRSVAEAQPLISIIEQMGYQYWAENPNPNKMFFVKGMPPFGMGRTHHIHVVQYDSDYFKARVAFRDFLIQHPSYAREYEHLKITLAAKDNTDREAYTDAKSEFITKILRLAGFKGDTSR